MTKRMGYNKLEVQIDSEITVSIITKHGNGNVSSGSPVEKIRSLLSLDLSVKIHHFIKKQTDARICSSTLK
jgi:hypothetical protein